MPYKGDFYGEPESERDPAYLQSLLDSFQNANSGYDLSEVPEQPPQYADITGQPIDESELSEESPADYYKSLLGTFNKTI